MSQEKSQKNVSNLPHNVNSQKCIRCGKILRVSDEETGEIICGVCGYVISEQIANTEPEWSSFSDETSKQRTGSNMTLARHDMGLSTIISPVNRDATGKPLSAAMKSTVKRLRIWEKRSDKSTDKNFIHAFAELERIKDKLVVSDAVVEKAAYIYRKIVEHKLTKGRHISIFVAASLYAACRITGTPRTIKDMQNATNVSRRDLTKYYRIIIREFDLQIPVVDPVQCVARIANIAGVSEKTRRFAVDIIHKAKQYGILEGKDPTSIAATAIYIAGKKMKEFLSQRKIASAANITEITIRNRTKGLQVILKL